MLHKYELSVAKEEADKVDTLRYTWEKLLSRNTEVQNELLALQPNFRGELVGNVETFLEDCQHFYQDYEKVKEMRDRKCTCKHTVLSVLTRKASVSPRNHLQSCANFSSLLFIIIAVLN